ncbi:NB-ARC domain containing protein [Trema orientale]|uniref:NB-ARC domain containing protein n=1 Tax=Trema orientale TaxID=63057 RepID=A0A2P5D5I5_TREOI|nr:NB-ARC domain containing protein [Trema orientale]
MEMLKQRLEDLDCRKEDVESRMDDELILGTTLKKEVKHWLEGVQKVDNEVKVLEQKVKKVKYFSRARLGKSIFQKIQEVEEFYRKGEFSTSLVISLSQNGEILPTSTLGGETTSNINMEKIWACLMDDNDDKVSKIGVYGMGGIGKTTVMKHINNRLLEMKGKFDNVFWVTVSKASNIITLQDAIASKLRLDISMCDDETTRAARLHAELSRKKRYVLILDDLWEVYRLEDVGIPEPTTQKGCKLVLTTRSLDVCRGMSCKPIQIKRLSQEEALNLFLNIVGHDVLSIPNLRSTVNNVAEECSCLPLAIVTIAGSLKGIVDPNEWSTALEDLRASRNGAHDEIYEKLIFSYRRLKDGNLQACLLYCALFPEDYAIERNMLIEYLIAEGIISGRNSRKAEFEMGHAMLNKLVDSCLLEATKDRWDSVKMHDVIRDMAIQITREQPRFLVEAGMRLQSIPDQEKWKEDLGKVSLMCNDIIGIPSTESPECPILSTLLLHANKHLATIPDNFFLHMVGLNVLDLSRTSIVALPKSVSDLVNLNALLLRDCHKLIYVPSFEKLTALRKLDFYRSGITEVPSGMEKLVKLRYLNFDECKLKMIPEGIVSQLSNLQYLSLNREKYGSQVRGEEIACLKKLETFCGVLYDINGFNTYVRSLKEARGLTCYILKLGFFDNDGCADGENVKAVSVTGIRERVADEEFPLVMLPKDVQDLTVDRCHIKVSSLCKLMSFENATSLRSCRTANCGEIEHLFCSSLIGNVVSLKSLETLKLKGLRNLRGLIKMEPAASSLVLPPGTFSSLRDLDIYDCHSIEKGLPIDASLPNLEALYIESCGKLVEVISTTSDAIEINFPKLETFYLLAVPELQSICKKPMAADSVKIIKIFGCPKLRRVPFLDRPCPPSSLERIMVDRYWWRSLIWDNPNANDYLLPFCED